MRLIVFQLILIAIFATTASADRSPLTGSDIEFVGAFKLPDSASHYGIGIAVRNVAGSSRVLLTNSYNEHNYDLFEIATLPTLRTTPPFNAATIGTTWTTPFAHITGYFRGMYWDSVSERLYYSSGDTYKASGDPYDPSISYLDGFGGSLVSHGRWGLANRSVKMSNNGVTLVPEDFATDVLGDSTKRLAAGFGGTQSVWSFGPVSLGPALAAFTPPTNGATPTSDGGAYLGNVPLVSYRANSSVWTSGDRPTVDRCWRDDDVLNSLWSYGFGVDPDASADNNPTDPRYSGDEIYYWQGYSVTNHSRDAYLNNVPSASDSIKTKHWSSGNAFWGNDYLEQAGAWVQTTNKEGIIFVASFSVGNVWYISSEPRSEGFKHQLLIYSREQFASVVGGLAEDQIQPARYTVELPGITYPFSSWSGGPAYNIDGVAFDPVTSKLFIKARLASNAPTINSESTAVIYVYQVNDTSSAVNGACGSADGVAVSSPPTTNLCSAGNAGTVTKPEASYIWDCVGTNGGTTDNCSALYSAPSSGNKRMIFGTSKITNWQ